MPSLPKSCRALRNPQQEPGLAYGDPLQLGSEKLVVSRFAPQKDLPGQTVQRGKMFAILALQFEDANAVATQAELDTGVIDDSFMASREAVGRFAVATAHADSNYDVARRCRCWVCVRKARQLPVSGVIGVDVRGDVLNKYGIVHVWPSFSRYNASTK